jgi:predicted HD superfamily hydrolase involved in NAD metabolism
VKPLDERKEIAGLDIDAYLPFLRQTLTPKRLAHSLGVMQVMGELAEVYSLDREKALTVGLLHDAAKDLTPAQQAEIIAEAHIEIHHAEERDYVLYLHGPVGAWFVRKELGITDDTILEAICGHTFYGNGQNFEAALSWCVRFSDLLEPNRDWSQVKWLRKGLPRLKEAVYGGRMSEGAFLQTGWLIQWFEEEQKPIHPNIRRIYRALSVQLNLDSTYLA